MKVRDSGFVSHRASTEIRNNIHNALESEVSLIAYALW
jgi:hypothetical protein